jgi:predicted dithiol-disulfide oxidoreductase (DUF899 family)
VEFMMLYYGAVDRTPSAATRGDQPMMWVRRHDEYDSE